jgi:basic amino acid/polyamine antiporter, APA family
MDNPSPNKIGLHTATSVVVGSIIGSGIFMKPATMAGQTGSAPMLIGVWLAAGLISLCGALIFAEASAMFPKNGGLYVFLEKMYGNFAAFLFGWSALAVINTAAIAAISFVCAEYAGYLIPLPTLPDEIVSRYQFHLPGIGTFFPLEKVGVKSLAVAILILLGWLNARSLQGSGRLQLVSTLLKVGAIVLLVGGIFLSGHGNAQNMVSVSETAPTGMTLLGGIMGALTGAFMAYDGWQCISYMGGEVEHPEKNLPRSIILGVASCTAIYVLVNMAYTYALPIDEMAQSSLVASDAMEKVLGRESGTLITVLIVLSTLGAINGNIMSTTRITQAMAQDGFFFKTFGRIHPRFLTPVNTIWLHTVWCGVFVFSGTFDMLADMFVFITWTFIVAACIGLMLLRRTMPHHPRPYRMWGYPWLLLVFTAFAAYYVGSTLYYEIMAYQSGKAKTINSLLGILITGTGIPLYFFFAARNKKNVKNPGGQSGL